MITWNSQVAVLFELSPNRYETNVVPTSNNDPDLWENQSSVAPPVLSATSGVFQDTRTCDVPNSNVLWISEGQPVIFGLEKKMCKINSKLLSTAE